MRIEIFPGHSPDNISPSISASLTVVVVRPEENALIFFLGRVSDEKEGEGEGFAEKGKDKELQR